MRKVVSLAVAFALSGCATHYVPQGPKPQKPKGIGSTDWSAVAAIPKRHFIFVTVDGGDIRRGYIWSADDATLTIRALDGEETVPRAAVVRVAVRVLIGTKQHPQRHWYDIPIAAAILGGLAGVIVGAVTKNASLRHASWLTFAVGLGAGMGLGEAGYPGCAFEDRLVYLRP